MKRMPRYSAHSAGALCVFAAAQNLLLSKWAYVQILWYITVSAVDVQTKTGSSLNTLHVVRYPGVVQMFGKIFGTPWGSRMRLSNSDTWNWLV